MMKKRTFLPCKRGEKADVVEISPGVNMELDSNGNLIGVELFKAPLCLKMSLNQWKKNFRLCNYPFITLVDQILAAKQKDPQTVTSALESQIDIMVYKLYGITYEEVKIVDPMFAVVRWSMRHLK
jgi:uncharacterized protein YuzE